MSQSEKLNNPLYLTVAANLLARECQKMVINTIENNQQLDLMTLSKYLSLIQNSLDQSIEELKKNNSFVLLSDEEMRKIYNFSN